jgi:hypothetical protein
MGLQNEEQVPPTPQQDMSGPVYGYVPQGFPQYGQVPPQFIPYANVPGYMPVPAQPFALHQPFIRAARDIGSGFSYAVGVVLGLFAPITSLVTLCCYNKLRFKHGLSVGHAAHYAISFISALVFVLMLTYSGPPQACSTLDVCVNNAVHGINGSEWGPYIAQCSYTLIDRDDYDNSTVASPCQFNATAGDYSSSGPQTVDCATCVCTRLQQDYYCQNTEFITMYSWGILCVYALALSIAVRASKYFRAKIAAEMMHSSVVRL